MKKLVLTLALSVLCLPVHAGQLEITVLSQEGVPLTDAVVTVHPQSAPPADKLSFDWPARMVQEDISFKPHVLIVPKGAQVEFPNLDKVRHHVYSFSSGNQFELKLYGREEHRTVLFENTGIAAVGCNIHDEMSAFIHVVDTPWAAKTDRGAALFEDVPAGRAMVTVWHPALRNIRESAQTDMEVPADGSAGKTVKLAVRASALPAAN